MPSQSAAIPCASALVVEDEDRLRKGLLDLLAASGHPWRRLEGAADAEEPLALLAETPWDVAFLDIRLPGMSGLELAAKLPRSTRIVFTTAYDTHAIEAFERGAVDYLLKPITPERLARTLERLGERSAVDLDALFSRLAPPTPPEPLAWVSATSGRRTRLIPVDEVRVFQAEAKLTRADTPEGSHYLDLPIKTLAARLDPRFFIQIHRSTLVNLRFVAWLERGDGEGARLHLKDSGATFPVSAPFLKALRARF